MHDNGTGVGCGWGPKKSGLRSTTRLLAKGWFYPFCQQTVRRSAASCFFSSVTFCMVLNACKERCDEVAMFRDEMKRKAGAFDDVANTLGPCPQVDSGAPMAKIGGKSGKSLIMAKPRQGKWQAGKW
jgi:hypothetical protein